jgi:2-keto-4-pentenoate hydratase
MDAQAIQAASDLLYSTWRSGGVLTALPEPIRPRTRLEGYAIQARLEARSPSPLYGWKIAATSKAGQAHIGVDGPLAGRILAERVAPSGGSLPFHPNRMAVAEIEFAFRFARSLPPRAAPFEVDEVLSAVGALHPAIEIPDSRYVDFVAAGAPQLIADAACAHYFVAGEATQADWRRIDLARHTAVGRIAGRHERDGIGGNVLGDPRIALTWLANELRMLGVTLAAGQMVTTGTCMQPLDVRPGDRVDADFGAIGDVAIVLAGTTGQTSQSS